jgi:iron complex outermembrane recepter protein
MAQPGIQCKSLIKVTGCLLGLATASAYADKAVLEEVTVTAQKREENIQAVPLSITALSSADMEKRGITSYEGVARDTPSIAFTRNPASSSILILYMRGQGVSDPAQITQDGAVGMYEDGFYIARPQGATFDLADVERIEVLHGPQGTLYGRNTTGGAVNIVSKKPTGEFGFKQKLTFGTRDLFRSVTSIDLPRVGGFASKVTLLQSSIDGYVKNPGTSHDFGEEQQRAGRFFLSGELTDSLALDYFIEKGDLDSTPIYYQNTAFNGLPLFPGYPYDAKASGLQSTAYRPVDLDISRSDFEGHGLTLSWNASDSLTIKSLTGFRKLNFHNTQDYMELFGFRYDSDSLVHQDQLSQEVQFIGNLLDNHINYVAGLYYFEETGSRYVVNDFPGFTQVTTRYITTESKSKAVFGQVSWIPEILEERLELTLGGRYTKDEKAASRRATSAIGGGPATVSENGAATGAVNDLEFSKFNPSFTVKYQWTSDISAYLRAATGYKAGGSLESGPPGKFNQTFDPETITSYEAGLKSYWLDHRLRLNAAYFDSRIKDMQLVFSGQPGNPSVTQAYNAGEARIKGFELGVLVAPIEDVTLNLDYTRLIAQITKVDVIPGTIFDGATNLASPYRVGDNINGLLTLPYAPAHSLNVGADYTFLHLGNADLTAHLDYRFQSKVYNSAAAGPDLRNRDFWAQGAYGIFNARLTLDMELPHGDKAKVALWGKNITRKQYAQSALANGSTLTGYTSKAIAWAEPASYGIDLSYEY